MQLNSNNKKIIYNGEDIVNIIKEISFILPNGGSYKKVYCSWNISDWRFMKTEAELRKEWDSGNKRLHETYKTYEEVQFAWKKAYKNK